MNICVFGASSAYLEESYYKEAQRLGELLAEADYGLVFGAGDTGLMGAIARGVKDKGGKIIGIAPKFFDRPGVLYQQCDEMIFTETMRERKQLMEELSDAVIVLPGGIGTYEEFFEILTLKQLGQTKRPIVLFDINGYYKIMQELLEATAKQGFMSEENLTLCQIAGSAREVIEKLESECR